MPAESPFTKASRNSSNDVRPLMRVSWNADHQRLVRGRQLAEYLPVAAGEVRIAAHDRGH
jgi:hypothetical protein